MLEFRRKKDQFQSKFRQIYYCKIIFSAHLIPSSSTGSPKLLTGTLDEPRRWAKREKYQNERISKFPGSEVY
jgi:hypothetical protein